MSGKAEKIAGYRCTDGAIFEDEKMANKHQGELDLQEGLKKLVDSECYSGMGKTEVLSFLLANKLHLADLFQKTGGNCIG